MARGSPAAPRGLGTARRRAAIRAARGRAGTALERRPAQVAAPLRGRAAGVPERLCHPHALRAYYATTLASEGVPVHVIAARLGHAEIQTTSRYLAELADDGAAVGDVLDCHHQGLQRRRVGRR